jgi:hypothetical protein
LAEALIRAHEGPWAVIVPGFGNANPNGPLSWAIFLLDYGRWLAGLPAGEIRLAPTHNSSYKREVLLSIGPAARRPRPWGRDDPPTRVRRSPSVLRAVGGDRSPQRHPARGLAPRTLPGRPGNRRTARDAVALVDAAPLYRGIPSHPGGGSVAHLRHARRETRLPFGTLPALIIGAMVSAMGELVGYAWGIGTGVEEQMTEYEVHKVRYV